MSSRNAAVSNRYQKKSHLQHIKDRPDSYIGSCESRRESMWVIVAGKMEYREITYVPALFKIFDEILSNAADNKHRDPNMKSIKVNMTEHSITVENDGNGIPVEKHAEHHIYVPQMVFGELLTGDNYDDSEERVGGGRNGYGAKLTNIFSKSFCIETVDSNANKKYSQQWSDNMTKVTPPHITSGNKRKDYTRVTFAPDFERFGQTKLTEDMLSLFRKRVYDIAGTTQADVRVYLNGAKLPVQNFKQYCEMYTKGQKLVHEKVNARWEVCVTMAPDQQPQQVSFCNSICTSAGGEHVKYVSDHIARKLLPHRAFKDLNVRPFMVTRSMFIFVNALVVNPCFDSQTKETLTTRASKFGAYKPVISDKFVKSIVKHSGIVEEVTFFARAKSQRQLERKTGGTKKTTLTGIPKLDDATFAGGRRSKQCTLILTEGDSAKSLAIAGLSVIGRQRYGVFPLKGKLLNVRDASNAMVGNNAEIQHLLKIVGLNIGTTYTSTDRLRYGSIMIMTDQDHDGSHIKGLIINFLHHFWPALLQIPNFLQVFITPIVKCTRRGQASQVFYTTPEFDLWKQSNVEGWHIKYYKGLGTSSAKEAKEYFSNLPRHRIPFGPMTEADGQLIHNCFSKKEVQFRKTWISGYEEGTHMNFDTDEMSYSDFVDKEYIIMAVKSNMRGIPHVMDGFKPSQRKILFACLKRKLHAEIKVAQLAGYTSEHASYHHGEASLNGAIINMAQDFVGSNNINLLTPNGQFGTRLMGGKDAASPRYVFTQLSAVTELIFHPDDAALYTYLNDDGQQIEPAHYVPVIPMLLVNGSSGIGTGWSSTIPSYNPGDIIDNLRTLLSDSAPKRMVPWFRGFTGQVVPVQPGRWHTRGTFRWSTATKLEITELPVGTWTNKYKEMLEKQLEGSGSVKKGHVLHVACDYTDTAVHFTVTMSTEAAAKYQSNEADLVKAFKLSSTVDTNNMHAFDKDGRLQKYNSELDILQQFFERRLELYQARKLHQIKCVKKQCSVLTDKVRFINMVTDGSFQFRGREKAVLMSELTRLQFVGEGFDYLLNMPLWNLTDEKSQSLALELTKYEQELDQLHLISAKHMWLHDLDNLERKMRTSKKRSLPATTTSNKVQRVK